MVFQLKAAEIESTLRNSIRGNSIELKTEALITAGEYVVYGDGLLGQVLSIVDYNGISKWERIQCGLPKRGIGSARYVLMRQIETREGVFQPQPGHSAAGFNSLCQLHNVRTTTSQGITVVKQMFYFCCHLIISTSLRGGLPRSLCPDCKQFRALAFVGQSVQPF